MLKELPKFRNFVVDLRLKEFRCVKSDSLIFIKFDTIEGSSLLKEYIKKLDKDSQQYKELLKSI